MTDFDERPINPDKEYLEKAEASYLESKTKIKGYLKKNNDESLPCFRNNWLKNTVHN